MFSVQARQVVPNLYWTTGVTVPKFIAKHLESLNGIFHVLVYLYTPIETLLPLLDSSPSGIRVYRLRLHDSKSGRSLMQQRNKLGPRTKPWGTPESTGHL